MHASTHSFVFRLFAFSFCWATFSSLPAAEEVQCVFRVVTWKNADPEALFYVQEGQPIKIEGLQASRRSDMHRYQGGSSFMLYDPASLNVPVAEGKTPPPPRPLAEVSLPKDIQHALLILFPAGEDDPLPYRVLVMNDDPDSFPFPSYKLVNFSRQRAAVILGKQRIVLEPGQQKLTTSDEKTVNLLLAIPGRDGREWSLVYDNFFPNWAEERSLVFIVEDTRNGKSRVIPRVILENRRAWELAIETLKTDSKPKENP
ncbi:MAG: hypothetical protein WD490_08855 [Opitutales bacterium]